MHGLRCIIGTSLVVQWLRKSESVSLSVALCDPMDCSPPGYSVHGIFQARILEWGAIPFSRGSSRPRNRTLVSCSASRFFTIRATTDVHWLRICLPMQGTLVWSLVEISQAVGQLSPCSAITDPKLQSPRSAATEACILWPVLRNKRSLRTATRESLCMTVKTQCSQRYVNTWNFLKRWANGNMCSLSPKLTWSWGFGHL